MGGGWGRTRAEIETEVGEIMTALVSGRPPPPMVVVEAVARS
jgi:hypothetical protein